MDFQRNSKYSWMVYLVTGIIYYTLREFKRFLI